MTSIPMRTPMNANDFETRLERAFTWLFDNQSTARVYALHMIVVGISNIVNDGGNVNRALIGVLGVNPLVVHMYMLLVIGASVVILAKEQAAWWWYLIGISYIVLILSSVFALAIVNPTEATVSAAFRIFALNGLLFFLLIKNLRRGMA